MEDFKNLWEEILIEFVLPKGYLNTIRETMDDSILMSKAFQYCIIMRTKEGLEEFLNYYGPYDKFFKQKLTESLNLQNQSEENKNKIIVEYLKNAVINNGFISHTTNNLSAENIVQYGFRKIQTEAHTQGVLAELKEIFPEGVFKTDLNYLLGQEERTGWFYDRSPYHFKRYANGPEWFKRLVGSTNFLKRDYQGAKNFILNTINYYEVSPQKKQEAISFLDKYWSIYAPTTPHMLLISIKDNEFRNEKEIAYVKSQSIEEQITYYTDTYFRITDQNSDKKILPQNIIDIDMYDLEKRMELSITKL